MRDEIAQVGEGAVVPIGRRQHDVAKRRGPEGIAHCWILWLHVQAAEVVVLEWTIAFPGSELGQGNIVELVIGERGTIVTDGAAETQKIPGSDQLLITERLVVSRKKAIPGRLVKVKAIDHEARDRVARMRESHLLERRARISCLEHPAVFRNRAEPGHNS